MQMMILYMLHCFSIMKLLMDPDLEMEANVLQMQQMAVMSMQIAII